MTDRSALARSSSHVAAESQGPGSSSSIRPRNRRLISTQDDDAPAPAPASFSAAARPRESPILNPVSGLLSAFSPATSRSSSPLPSSKRPGVATNRAGATASTGGGNIGQFLSDSWTQSWSSVQELTSSLFTGDDATGASLPPRRGPTITINKKPSFNWGPAPPSQTPSLNDVAAGSLVQRETALKAAKTASVLESHDGVNGGLDTSGKHKRRNSDEVVQERPQQQEDYLAYVHRVQPSDTFAGLILRYRCREDVFRRANGLWSRDSIQTRKWVLIPVDACDLRGRPCEAPSANSTGQGIDLLAPTPHPEEEHDNGGDFFTRPTSKAPAETGKADDVDRPWVHVRWVQIDSMSEPIEIGRVSRGSTGYFPPRRRKSVRSVSAFSTPRQSLDLSSVTPGSADGGHHSRRPSSLSSKPQLLGTPASTRSRLGSDAADSRPAWMKRPGGVGTMSRSIRAPGPGKDYFNTWTNKHIPGLNIDELPSMSVMGAESAHWGIVKDSSGIVESPFEEGRDASTANRQGTGLDRAAAAVETWLRGALAKRPSTPLRGARARSSSDQFGAGGSMGDLIELADTGSEDGRLNGDAATSYLDSSALGSSSRSDASGSMRGRVLSSRPKGAKSE